MWILELLGEGLLVVLGFLLGGIVFLVGAAIALIIIAIQSAVGGAVIGTIFYLLSLAFGYDIEWVTVFQSVFWTVFVVDTLITLYKFLSD